MTGTVGVIGGGIMGSGIAEVAARAGFDVLVRESDHEPTVSRLSFTTDLADLVSGCAHPMGPLALAT